MKTTSGPDKKICVWRYENKKFSVSLDFLIGIGTMKAILQDGQNEVAGSAIAGVNLNLSKVKVVEDLSNPSEVINSTAIKVLVLHTDEYVLGTKIDELLFYGEEGKFQNAEGSEIFAVNENHICELGSKKEIETLDEKNERAVQSKNFVFFNIGHDNYAIDVKDVCEVLSSRLAVEYKLVSNQAIGYFQSKGETIPVLSLGGMDFKCEKMIVTTLNKLKFGFPVHSITNLIRDFDDLASNEADKKISYNGEQWSLFDPVAALKGIKLKEICDGYENIFSKKQSLLKSQTNSVLKSLVLLDIGEKVCVAAELIRKVEALQVDFDPRQVTFIFNEQSLPLIDARKHYGFTKNADKKTVERILILEKENTLISVLVSSVDSIVYIDQKSISAYGEWIFRESNANFKKDVAGMIHVLDYQHKDKMNLVNISFDTIFDKYKTAS